MTRPTRELPEDWFEVAPGKSIAQLTKHYGASVRKIGKWRKMTGVANATMKPPPLRLRPIPDDFAEMCPKTTKRQLAKYYQTGIETIHRWMEATGLSAKQYVHIPMLSQMGRQRVGYLADIRTKSMFDEAADILRRERFVVHRCNEKGAYAQAGDFYRVGNVVCSPDELLRRADRYRQRAA